MSQFHVHAIFKQFPWLDTLYKDRLVIIKHAKVARIDTKILEETWSDSSLAFLLNSKGELLAQIGIRKRKVLGWDFLFLSRAERIAERKILENASAALLALNHQAEEAHYLTVYGRRTLTVYKPPRDFTIIEWIEEERKRATEEVSIALAQIDRLD
jgi:hypothetical protein